jgi:nitroreductase
MNKQPWHFTVVRDQALARQIISGMASGNVVIAISAPDSVIKKGTAVFDCGLAAESMYLAAQTLGLGSRIYTGPVESVNSRLKERLELPRDFSVVALVRIGLVEKVDAVSAASSRQSVDSKVNYK